jgi:hypothetical protein
VARARDRNDYDKSFLFDPEDTSGQLLSTDTPTFKPAFSGNALTSNMLSGDFILGPIFGRSSNKKSDDKQAVKSTTETPEDRQKRIADKKQKMEDANNFLISQDVNRIKKIGDANLELYKQKSKIDLDTNWQNQYQQFAWGAQRLQNPNILANQVQNQLPTSGPISDAANPFVRAAVSLTNNTNK